MISERHTYKNKGIAPGKLAGRPIGKVHLPGFMAAAGTLPGYAAASFWASARPFAVKAR